MFNDWVEYNIESNKPRKYKPVWIQTFQDHINLAWYINDRFWPYGGDITDGHKPFGDKFGDCNVCFWQYAKIPDGMDS